MVRTACFSREQLRDFSLGCISAEEEARIAAHLDQCESCQQAAAECDCSADSLVAALRLPEDALSDDDVHCDAALVRAKQLAAGSVDARHERTEPIRLREYELLRKLGEGGMGTVYLARHTRLDRIVALKILPPDRMRDASAVARFEREMRAVGGLDHPAIVRATDAGDVDGTHFLVMEYVEGLDLSSLVERLGPIGIADACELVRQAALGLQHVHERGMVHRDIKPSNLMLTPRGEVKILDLGLALLQRGDGEVHGITTVGRFMGTLDYMAPEQADDSHEVDVRADVYGLGATLYRLICGVPPFAGKEYRSPLKKLKALATEPVPPVRERRPEVPAGLAQVIERMLAKEPEARFGTPAGVAEVLQPFAAGSDLVKLQQDAESSQLAPQVDSSLAEQVNDSQQSERRSDSPKRIRRLLLVLLALAAALVAGAAIYVETDRGTLVIQSPDPGVEVLIRRGGKPVDDWELERGENRTTVRSGSYEIVLIGASDGLRVKDGTFTLTRGGEHVATIERIAQRGKATDSVEAVPAIIPPARRREAATAAAAAFDRTALQGTWEVVSGDVSGEQGGPGDKVQRWLKVRFDPNEFVIWDRRQSVEAKGPYMLHPAEQPQTIILCSIHSRGSADRKIYWARYELNGDRLRLAISDQKSPTGFEPDKDTSVLVLRRTAGRDVPRAESPQSATQVKIISLVNADATEAANIARQLMPDDRVQIATDWRTNSVLVQGRASDLDKLAAIFIRLDEKPKEPSGSRHPSGGEAAERLSFDFENAPWPDVLKLVAETAGLTLDMRDVPPGSFSYHDRKAYSPSEALDVLNGYLISRGYVLVRRDNFLVSLQIGNIPENLIPTVTIDELPQRGRYELLNVVFPLEGVRAEDWVDEVRNLLDVVGSKGQVAVLERSNAIAVSDFGGNLRRVQGLLSDVLARPGLEAVPAESLRPANVLGLSLRPAASRELGAGAKDRGGLVVEQVRSSSPASAAGIRAGDVLVGLGEWETTTIDSVHSAVQRTTAANLRSLKFYILRDGETVSGTFALPDAPAADKPRGESAAVGPVPEPIYGGRNPKTGLLELNPDWAEPVRRMLATATAIKVSAPGKDVSHQIPRAVRGDPSQKLLGVIAALAAEGSVSWMPRPESSIVVSTDKTSVQIAESLLPAALDRLSHPDRGAREDDRAGGALPEDDPRSLRAQVDSLRATAVENLLSELPYLYEPARRFWELSMSLQEEAALRESAQRHARQAGEARSAGELDEAEVLKSKSDELQAQAEAVAAERRADQRELERAQQAADEAKWLASKIQVLMEVGKQNEAAQLKTQLQTLLRHRDPDRFRVLDLQERIVDARIRGNHELADQLEAERRRLLEVLDERYPGATHRETDPVEAPQPDGRSQSQANLRRSVAMRSRAQPAQRDRNELLNVTFA